MTSDLELEHIPLEKDFQQLSNVKYKMVERGKPYATTLRARIVYEIRLLQANKEARRNMSSEEKKEAGKLKINSLNDIAVLYHVCKMTVIRYLK